MSQYSFLKIFGKIMIILIMVGLPLAWLGWIIYSPAPVADVLSIVWWLSGTTLFIWFRLIIARVSLSKIMAESQKVFWLLFHVDLGALAIGLFLLLLLWVEPPLIVVIIICVVSVFLFWRFGQNWFKDAVSGYKRTKKPQSKQAVEPVEEEISYDPRDWQTW